MRSLILLTMLVMAAATLSAHHTAAYIYDVEKPVVMKATVTEVDWKNPHVLVHVDVKGDDGAVANWTLEARAVYIMKRQGIPQDFMRAGDVVSLTVCPAKDGSHMGGLESVDLASGTTRVGECVRPR